MSPLIRRSKMICFRLTAEEYRMLQNACGSSNGARSISDLARKTILQSLVGNGPTDLLSDKVRSLQDRVRRISLELERIAPLVEGSKSRNEAAASAEVAVPAQRKTATAS